MPNPFMSYVVLFIQMVKAGIGNLSILYNKMAMTKMSRPLTGDTSRKSALKFHNLWKEGTRNDTFHLFSEQVTGKHIGAQVPSYFRL